MTITEIAEIAGVSPATVSRVFNHSEMVSENTKQKVLKAIKEYDYIPNPSFGNLSLQRISNNIGLFVPDMDNPFFNSIVKGVTQIADKYRYNIVLFNTDELPDREHRFLQAVWELNLKGLIMIPISSNDEESEEHLHKLEEIGLPVVLVDRKIGNYLCDSVFTEDAADSLRAVEALIAAGHKKIATITGSLRSTPGEERLRGYEQAMARHQLKIPSGYVEEGNFKIRRGREAALRLLSLPDPPTAIFTASNFTTLGALQSMVENGWIVGRDISVLGFDEIARWQWYPLLHSSGIGLSLVERPVMQMAEEAMELLQSRITGRRNGKQARRRLLLSNRIVLRGSERKISPEENRG